MSGRGWWQHWLKADVLYLSSIQFFRRSLFSGVAGMGKDVGGGGGVALGGHEQVLVGVPEEATVPSLGNLPVLGKTEEKCFLSNFMFCR